MAKCKDCKMEFKQHGSEEVCEFCRTDYIQQLQAENEKLKRLIRKLLDNRYKVYFCDNFEEGKEIIHEAEQALKNK